MSALTAEQRRRVEQAMDETQRGQARAEGYGKFQDRELVNFYRGHIAKLTAMLEGREGAPQVWINGYSFGYQTTADIVKLIEAEIRWHEDRPMAEAFSVAAVADYRNGFLAGLRQALSLIIGASTATPIGR